MVVHCMSQFRYLFYVLVFVYLVDIRTQYIVIELTNNTTKETLKKIQTTLQTVLNNFHDRINMLVQKNFGISHTLEYADPTSYGTMYNLLFCFFPSLT